MKKASWLLLIFISGPRSASALVIQDLPSSAQSASLGPAAPALLELRGEALANPAALAFRGLSPNSLSTTFVPMSLGRYAQSLAYARALRHGGALGLQAQVLSVGGIEGRDESGQPSSEFRYTEWEAGGGAAYRSRYHVAAGLLLLGSGQSLAGASAAGLQSLAGVLLRPFLTYPLHLGVTTRLELIPRLWASGHSERLAPEGKLALGYELLPSLWAGGGMEWGQHRSPAGAALSWSQDELGVSLRASANSEVLCLGGGYLYKGRFRLDYAFVLGLTGPATRHLATTEFEF